MLNPQARVRLYLVSFTIAVLCASNAGAGDATASPEATFFAALLALILVGRLLGEAMNRIGQPSVMGPLLAGILLGPSVLGWLYPDFQHWLFASSKEQGSMLSAISQVGILLLLLLTGMETDLKLVRRAGRAALSISSTGVVVPLACGVALGWLLPEVLAARPRKATAHVTVSRYGPRHLVHQDCRGCRARNEVRPAQPRADYRGFRHPGGHSRLDSHRHHVQPRRGRTDRFC